MGTISRLDKWTVPKKNQLQLNFLLFFSRRGWITSHPLPLSLATKYFCQQQYSQSIDSVYQVGRPDLDIPLTQSYASHPPTSATHLKPPFHFFLQLYTWPPQRGLNPSFLRVFLDGGSWAGDVSSRQHGAFQCCTWHTYCPSFLWKSSQKVPPTPSTLHHHLRDRSIASRINLHPNGKPNLGNNLIAQLYKSL